MTKATSDMPKPSAHHAACFLFAVATSPSALAQAPITRTTPTEAAVDAVFKRYDSKDTPGCSVAVIDAGKVLLKKSYGMADPSLGVPRTSATSHWIPYSEARVFVALAVAMLERDGKISWNDPIRKHIPEVPAYASAVTVRQLLHHTSGLADYGVLDPGFDSMWSRISEDEFFRVLARWNKLGFTPGTGKMYSNTDYALLEMLVERVSSGSLHDYLHAQLLKPLGMTSTRIGADQAIVQPGHTLFHNPHSDGFQRIFPYRTSPVGGISVSTNLDDMIRWEHALDSNAFGVRDLLTGLESGAKPHTSDNGREGFTFGVYRLVHKGLPVVAYHGVSEYTYLVQVPGTDLSVATLCNVYPGMEIFGADVARLYATPATVEAPATPAPTVGPVVDVPAAELQRYVGEYRNRRGQVFDIATAGNALIARPRGGAPMPHLRPVGGGQFRQDIDGSTYLLTFKDDDGDMVMSPWDVTANESGGQDLRRRAPRAWATAETLAAFAGTYVGDDIDATMYVRVEGDRVLMATHGRAEAPLEPATKPDHFGRWDIVEPRFERDASGRVVALILDATRVKGMRFTKKQ